jgi:hypothetical protein
MKMTLPITVLGAVALASIFGTPHWLHESSCRSYDGRRCAWLISCTYIGIQGWRKVYPAWEPDQKACPGIYWFKLDWPPFHWRNG